MRVSTVVLFLMSCLIQVNHASGEDPADAFSVTGYKLAFAEVDSSGLSINEYVPHGQTLENWTSLIAVRKWPNENNLHKVIGGYRQHIANFMIQEPTVYSVEGKSKANEQILEVFLAPKDKAYVEYNVVRFFRDHDDGSVKSYQLSYRLIYDLVRVRQFSASIIQSRIQTLSTLNLPIYADTNVIEDDVADYSDNEGMDEDSDDEDSDDEESDDEESDDEESDDEESDDEESDDEESDDEGSDDEESDDEESDDEESDDEESDDEESDDEE